MSEAKLRLRQGAQKLRQKLDDRHGVQPETLTASALGTRLVSLGAGGIARAVLPEGSTGSIDVVNSGRLASAQYKPVNGTSIISSGGSGGGSTGTTTTVLDHGSLIGLSDDDHAQYLNTTRGDARYYTETESDARFALLTTSITGTGALAGGGTLAANRTITMGTPGTLTVSSTSSSSTNHTHAITSSSNPGAAASLLASTAAGGLTLATLTTTGVISGAVNTNTSHDLGYATVGYVGHATHAGFAANGYATSGDYALLQNESNGAVFLNAPTGQTIYHRINNASIYTMDVNGIEMKASSRMQTENYASQTTGWRVGYAGDADYRYIFTDELHAKSFIADLEQALAGGQIICKSVATLAIAFTAPAASGTATLRVNDLPSAANMAVFQSGDIVRLRQFSRASGSLSIADCWGVVTSYTDQTDGTQTWTFTRSAAPNAGAMATSTVIDAESIVLDYGTTGNGFYEVNAIDGVYGANSPYAQVATWTTHPATGTTVRGRYGKLSGLSIGVANEFGIAVGSGFTTTDQYFKASNVGVTQNNVDSTWRSGGTTFASVDSTNGFKVESVNSTATSNQRAYSFTISGAEAGGLYHYYNATYTEAVLSVLQSSASRNNSLLIQSTAPSTYNARVYIEARESGWASASIDMNADIGSSVSQIAMAAGSFKIDAPQVLSKYSDGSGGDGFASAPLYSFTDDTNTGIYRSAADTLNFATGGTSRLSISTSAVSSTLPIRVTTASEGMRITGSATGDTSIAYLAFYDSGGTRMGYIGDASSGNSDIYVKSDGGGVRIGDSVNAGVIVVGGGYMYVNQSSTTLADAAVKINQADLSEEFIDFQTTVGTGNAIDTAAIGTYYGKARVAVNGTFKYIALYNS